MAKLLRTIWSLTMVSFLAASVSAHDRELLYPDPNSLSVPMQDLVKIIRNLHSDQVPLENLPVPGSYFVRIVPRKFVFKENNAFNGEATLAAKTKPFVFLTTPESIFGKSLLEIYADIGYEAEDIIRSQRNEDMVVILFRYRKDIWFSKVEDGKLDSDWPNRIYATTWDNILSLFPRLVQDERSKLCKPSDEPSDKPSDEPSTRICLPNVKVKFISSFPARRKQQVKKTEYRLLQGRGGPNWKYRKLLEDTLSVFEHFRGDGHTENELLEYRDKPAPARLREVVAPNATLKSLAEVAIIHLGKLTIEDGYSASHERLQTSRR